MRATFQEEEKELFETYLDTYVFPTQSTLPNKIIIGSPIELIIKPQCNQKCEYCYISQVNAWSEPTPLKYPPEYIAIV